jgi:hypothetical protein
MVSIKGPYSNIFRDKFCSIVYYPSISFLAQNSEDRAHSHSNLDVFRGSNYLSREPGSFIQADYRQIVRSLPIKILGCSVDCRECLDLAGPFELVGLNMRIPPAVGADVSWRKVVFSADFAVGPNQAIPLGYAPPEPRSLSC